MCKATSLLQKHIRSYIYSKKFKIWVAARQHSIGIIQRNVRKYFAIKLSHYYYQQKHSSWEQLWDDKHHLLYYYNNQTGLSQYEEPPNGEAYRPLIRDRLSASLLQAWPDLDGHFNSGSQFLPQHIPGELGELGEYLPIPKKLICQVCDTRKCVRFCLDCADPRTLNPYTQTMQPTAYCLPCYMREHPDDMEEKKHHRFRTLYELQDESNASMAEEENPSTENEGTEETKASPTKKRPNVLYCCMCNEMATRKCLGQFNDALIDSICSELIKVPKKQWHDVLAKMNILGERKLIMLVHQIIQESESSAHHPADEDKDSEGQFDLNYNYNSDDYTNLSPYQIQNIRGLLERTRAECDECYCQSCYQIVHSHGRRATHFWKSFAPGCEICQVCTTSPAEWHCSDCNSNYCESCFKVFHNMGKKRRHKKKVLHESVEDYGEGYCHYCHRKLGHKCSFEKCNIIACDECLEYQHKLKCIANKPVNPESSPTQSKPSTPLNPNVNTMLSFPSSSSQPISPTSTAPNTTTNRGPTCVVCNETADKICNQCGDYYCSRTWVGNPGCFLQFHSKGNRANHTTESINAQGKVIKKPLATMKSKRLF